MTVGYAPPEQMQGLPEPRSDIYALGATIHRMLTHHDAANNKPGIFSFPSIRTLRPDVSLAFDQVISTVRGSTTASYGFAAGASMAAPAASGVAALIKQRFPNISVGELMNRLAQSADDEGKNGHDPF